MIDTIYIEKQVLEHPRSLRILSRFPTAQRIEVEHYGEVFNVSNQDFRIQKQSPALILAKKQNRKVLSTPPGFGIGGHTNFYFSHLLNCIYDCRYCFLQGMYRSANYVLFVNYEDFAAEIKAVAASHHTEDVYFFSGYDSDSLALEEISEFTSYFLSAFEGLEHAYLELRTKSVAIRPLLARAPIPNVIVAFSLSPAPYAKRLDEKAPPVASRLRAIKALADAGWQIGLRFDPLIYSEGWQTQYEMLFDDIFSLEISAQIHSVSTGPLRFPKQMHKRISNLYPESLLFASPLEQDNGVVAYPKALEDDMRSFAASRITKELGKGRLFHCQSEGGQDQ